MKSTTATPQMLPGISSLIAATNELIQAAAMNDGPVFLLGEIGTERAFAAKLIHQLSPRAPRPMSKLNVSWKLPPDMAQYFKQSGGGTIIFNLQKEFPVDMQYTLVEMASHGCFADPISGEVVEADVRMILMTSLDIDQLGGRQALLPELKELLRQQRIEIPPLRSRREDIPALVRYAITRARESGRSKAVGADPQVLALFRLWNWPGNAEDLLLVTAQAAIAAKGDLVVLDDLPETFMRQLPPEIVEGARAVRSPRVVRPAPLRPSGDETPVAGAMASKEKVEDDPAKTPTPQEIQEELRARNASLAASGGAGPAAPAATPSGAEGTSAGLGREESKVPPRVLNLARRLNAQSTILAKQLSGPLDATAMQRAIERIMAEGTDDEALSALEKELDRGLDVVLTLRRQMAMLNLRQQQSAETIRDLVQRIALTVNASATPRLEPQAHDEIAAEARDLADSLRAIDSIVNRVSTELPVAGEMIESTLKGNVSDARPSTPSGIFLKPDLLAEKPAAPA